MGETRRSIHERFAAAQAKFGVPSKDKTNPQYRSRYADLPTVLEAVRGPLAEECLYLHQEVVVGDGDVSVRTRVVDADGDSIEFGAVKLSCGRIGHGGNWITAADPQSVGSAITYARRYGALTLGVAPDDDDDGNAAAAAHKEKPPTPKQAPTPQKPPLMEELQRLYSVADIMGLHLEGVPISKASKEAKKAWIIALMEYAEIDTDFDAVGVPTVLKDDPAGLVDKLISIILKVGGDDVQAKELPGY